MIIRPTWATRAGLAAMLVIILGSAAFLTVQYRQLPNLLPVHFSATGMPNGWQFKTPSRVAMPVFVEAALCLTLTGIGLLLLWRRAAPESENAPDVQAARTSAEAVVLIAAIWVTFQLYAAVALTLLWRTGRAGLGTSYWVLELAGVVLTGVVCARALAYIGRPAPLPYVPSHWRLGQLYCNADHPALFVPTRDGSRWTLNFGRPAAAMLMGLILAVGVALPVLILVLTLRS